MAKTSPPPSDGSGIADNGATEEAGAGAVEELCTGGAVELGTEATKELTPELQKKSAREPQKNSHPTFDYFKKFKTKSQDKEAKFNAIGI